MDVPQSWLVRPREALYDLDNLQLSAIPLADRTNGVRAVFGLDHLVIEGHAREEVTNAAPRGVQLQLTTNAGVPIADTLVVANLGYLQFRTKPGVFGLEIRPGRGREIFRMESVGNEGWNSRTVEAGGQEITLTSFEGLTLYPRLARLPGMERADVLARTNPRETHEHDWLGDIMSRYVTFSWTFWNHPINQTGSEYRRFSRPMQGTWMNWLFPTTVKLILTSSLLLPVFCTRFVYESSFI